MLQFMPVKLAVQLQLKPFTRSVQVPPLSHGIVSHSLISAQRLRPGLMPQRTLAERLHGRFWPGAIGIARRAAIDGRRPVVNEAALAPERSNAAVSLPVGEADTAQHRSSRNTVRASTVCT